MLKNFQIYIFYYSFLVFQILVNIFQIFFPVSPQIDKYGLPMVDSAGFFQLQPIWIWLTVLFQFFLFFFGIYLILQLAFKYFETYKRDNIKFLVIKSSFLICLFSPITFIFLFSMAKIWSLQILRIDFYNKPIMPFLAEIILTTFLLILQFILVLFYQKRLTK